MACEKHNWFFSTQCPHCVTEAMAATVTAAGTTAEGGVPPNDDRLEIPEFLRRREVRVWRDDNMRWIMVDDKHKAGDEVDWAGVKAVLFERDGVLFYKDR